MAGQFYAVPLLLLLLVPMQDLFMAIMCLEMLTGRFLKLCFLLWSLSDGAFFRNQQQCLVQELAGPRFGEGCTFLMFRMRTSKHNRAILMLKAINSATATGGRHMLERSNTAQEESGVPAAQ
jgi:hypothetical protein